MTSEREKKIETANEEKQQHKYQLPPNNPVTKAFPVALPAPFAAP